ncbi:hypothetical protein DFS33DRAFT_1459400 [Desarmillaria ectypa]|nr:hypothetical protein DFS33DRAFT_1459400 [Desarmillaria ectypa]
MDLSIINLDLFLSQPRHTKVVVDEYKKVADVMIVYGALLLRDSRVSEEDNSTFLDLLEDTFVQPEDIIKKDERPRYLKLTKKTKCTADTSCLRVIERLGHSESRWISCRLFWKMGDMPPYQTQFPGLNASNVVPQAEHIKEHWPPVMEKWGTSMERAVENLADMASIGLDLRAETYPGLHVSARNAGKCIPVKIPEGNYLLIHAGKQLEHIGGGLIKAGYYEVVVNNRTLVGIEERKREQPSRPLIRISLTFFWHLSSEHDMEPIPALAERSRVIQAAHINLGKDEEEHMVYEPMKVGQQVQNELKHIALMA